MASPLRPAAPLPPAARLAFARLAFALLAPFVLALVPLLSSTACPPAVAVGSCTKDADCPTDTTCSKGRCSPAGEGEGEGAEGEGAEGEGEGAEGEGAEGEGGEGEGEGGEGEGEGEGEGGGGTCGNGVVETGETCDVVDPHCSACHVDAGFRCSANECWHVFAGDHASHVDAAPALADPALDPVDLVVDVAHCGASVAPIDTSASTATICGLTLPLSVVAQTGDAPPLWVIAVRDLEIDLPLAFTGPAAPVILVFGDANLTGSIDVGAHGVVDGAGSALATCGARAGGAGAGGGGGGGALFTAGGPGGGLVGTAGAPGAAAGSNPVSGPLVAGCRGGDGGGGTGGGGGGALQLSVAGTFANNGAIRAFGGGALHGSPAGVGGGGGSGGAILIEASSVVGAGSTFVTGGGGAGTSDGNDGGAGGGGGGNGGSGVSPGGAGSVAGGGGGGGAGLTEARPL